MHACTTNAPTAGLPFVRIQLIGRKMNCCTYIGTCCVTIIVLVIADIIAQSDTVELLQRHCGLPAI